MSAGGANVNDKLFHDAAAGFQQRSQDSLEAIREINRIAESIAVRFEGAFAASVNERVSRIKAWIGKTSTDIEDTALWLEHNVAAYQDIDKHGAKVVLDDADYHSKRVEQQSTRVDRWSDVYDGNQDHSRSVLRRPL